MGFNKKFTQMIEHNEHEGESWSFWLQLDGNEVVIDELMTLIENEGLEDEYEFTGKTIYEFDVDTMVNHGNFGYGYMNQHHKIAGTITLDNGFQVNDIYKGQIEDFFKES